MHGGRGMGNNNLIHEGFMKISHLKTYNVANEPTHEIKAVKKEARDNIEKNFKHYLLAIRVFKSFESMREFDRVIGDLVDEAIEKAVTEIKKELE